MFLQGLLLMESALWLFRIGVGFLFHFMGYTCPYIQFTEVSLSKVLSAEHYSPLPFILVCV